MTYERPRSVRQSEDIKHKKAAFIVIITGYGGWLHSLKAGTEGVSCWIWIRNAAVSPPSSISVAGGENYTFRDTDSFGADDLY